MSDLNEEPIGSMVGEYAVPTMEEMINHPLVRKTSRYVTEQEYLDSCSPMTRYALESVLKRERKSV